MHRNIQVSLIIVFLFLFSIPVSMADSNIKQKKEQACFTNKRIVVLKKNIANGTCILTQNMFCKKKNGILIPRNNTVFVIKHNYDLGGATIIIPLNCTLYFDGGSFSNGKLVGQNTNIVYDKPIFTGMCFSGSWQVPIIYSWIMTDIASDKLYDLCCLQNRKCLNTIIITQGRYWVSIHHENPGYALFALSNTKMIVDGEIILQQENNNINLNFGYYIILSMGHNIEISGDGVLVGDLCDSLDYGEIGKTRYGHGVLIRESDDCTISGITINNCYGDGIGVSEGCTNIYITNVSINRWHGNAIAVVNTDGVVTIHNIKATNSGSYDPASVIDIEPNMNTSINKVIVDGLVADSVYDVISGWIPKNHGESFVKNVEIKNVEVTNLQRRLISLTYNNSSIPTDIALSGINATPSQDLVSYGAGYGINIISNGGLTVKDLKYDALSLRTTPSDYAFNINCSSSQFEHCMFAAQTPFGFALKNAIFKECIIKSFKTNSIAYASIDAPLSNITFKECVICSIIATALKKVKFEKCTFIQSSASTPSFYFYKPRRSDSTPSVEITGCSFIASFDDDLANAVAIELKMDNGIFRNNIIDNNSGKFKKGIVLSGNNNLVENNRFINFEDNDRIIYLSNY